MIKRALGIFIICFFGSFTAVKGQSFEVQQLLLNVEKLAQLKNILRDLKKGFEIVSAGYNTIKNISEGNFNLHQAFLDGLMQASPTVKKYKRVADIIRAQLHIVREYKSAFTKFKESNLFSPDEIEYLNKVYSNLFNQSLQCLDALSMVLRNGALRMSDDERLNAIDDIWKNVEERLSFLRSFNNETKVLALQRARERHDITTLNKLYGVNN